MNNNRSRLHKMPLCGMLAALSMLLIVAVRIPYPLFPAFVYDPGDIPLLLITFLIGPGYALLSCGVVCILQAIFLSADGWVGALMHFIATGALLLTAGLIYRRNRTKKGAVIALAAGAVAMALIMIPANLTITVRFYNVPYKVVLGMLPTAVIPFNLLKAGLNALITFVVYKKAGSLFRRYI